MIPIEIPTKEAKAEMETDPLTLEINLSKFSMYSKNPYFFSFLLINSF